ncbi:MAG: transposase [Eubacteriales bacterium]|nr:transposase [Eubacteriales bacterium]
MELVKRKRLRLAGYDYSSNGAYFVTVCTYNREQILGDIDVGQGLCFCRLSPIGRIVQDEIQNITNRYPDVKIDKYVVMPNHIHLILRLARQEQSPCPTIGDVICVIKSISTKNANKTEQKAGRKIWQGRFHDHIIRSDAEYQKIWQYIDESPSKWEEDGFFAK